MRGELAQIIFMRGKAESSLWGNRLGKKGLLVAGEW
jgi:hypothetical protein